MNLFQLILKQMRQRALGTWLTLLSVLLGMALAISILLFQRGSASLFGQTDYGFDVLVGSSKGSPLQLVLNSVYHLDKSPGAVPYEVYEQLNVKKRALPGQFDYRGAVKLAVPFMVGDTYKGRPIVATTPLMFGIGDDGRPIDPGPDPRHPSDSIFQYRPDRRYELAEGRVFEAKKFEAVIGSEVARDLNVKVGDKFKATHGSPGPNEVPDEHDELWQVVGVLKPTGTANDRVLFIPLISAYTIAEHDAGLKAHSQARMGQAEGAGGPAGGTGAGGHEHEENYELAADGTIQLKLPPDKWEISGVYVKSRGAFQGERLMYHVKNGGIPDVIAVSPAGEMRQFFDTFLKPGVLVLQAIALIVSIVAGVGILVSIYNSVAARTREIAILRALGATRGKILMLICAEAGLIGAAGGLAGWLLGHAVGFGGSRMMQEKVGQGFDWLAVGSNELQYWCLIVLLAVLAGLVPALKAYRTPVATNLTA